MSYHSREHFQLPILKLPARLSLNIGETWKFYSRELVRQIAHKDIFLWAQAIAFKVLITIVPVVLLITILVLNRDRSYDIFTDLIREFVPSYRADQLLDLIGEFKNAAGTLTLVAGVGLAITAATLMTTLRTVLSNVFVEDWHNRRSILEGYVFDILMSVCVGSFLVATISVSAFIQTLQLSATDVFVFLGLDFSWVREGWRTVISVIGYFLPIILSTGMFFVLYSVTPIPRPPKRSVFIGAVVAAVLWEAAKHAFTIYATHIGGSGVLSFLGDTFGIIIGFVLWAYYSGIVLILGALIVVLHEKRRRYILERRSIRNEMLKRI